MEVTPRAHPAGFAAPAPLLERVWELDAISQSLTSARRGVGSVVWLQGQAGVGASALLSAAADMTRNMGIGLLRATATELEHDFAFGVATQLFEPLWLDADPRDREGLLLGSAAAANELLTGTRHASVAEGADYRLIHALHWLTRNLLTMAGSDGSASLAIVVEDVHWADEQSARLLAYLARRCADLPLVLILSARTDVPSAEPKLLTALRRAPQTLVVEPQPLSGEAIAEICRHRLPEASDAFCEAVATASAGNPGLAVAIVDDVRHQEMSPALGLGIVSTVVPESVVEAMRHALDGMERVERMVAIGAAVLGEEATLPHLTAYGALSPGAVLAIVDELIGDGLLGPGVPFTYAQPVRRAAALKALGQAERGRAHARAARILGDSGAAPTVLAEHLLATIPGSDPRIAEHLTACGQSVLELGDSVLAAALFSRALREEPSDDLRAEILIGLHLAESDTDTSEAQERLAEAKEATDDPARYGEIVLLEAEALYAAGDYGAAARALDAGLVRLGSSDPQLADHMTELYVVAAALVPELRGEALRRHRSVLTRIGDAPSPPQRVALAHVVMHDAISGGDPKEVAATVRNAWGDGALLDSVSPSDLTLPMLFGALLVVDDLDLLDDMHHRSVVLGSHHPWLAPALRPLRGWTLLRRGRIAEAEAEARASAELDAAVWPGQHAAALCVIAACHIHRDDLGPAEAAIRALGEHVSQYAPVIPAQLLLVSELRLAEHRPEDALAGALEAGAAFERTFPHATPSASRWRSSAAAAHLALGDPEAALHVLEPELASGRGLAVLSTTIRALRIKGLALGGSEGIELLRDAVNLAEGAGERLEHVRALVDLGAALRRGNQRLAAREPLTRGLDLANRGGASALSAVAHTELIAAGARPRRLAFTGIDSLTVSQRRVAELAARGLTTRQIAEALFVTPKTVEFHLRQAYQKLNVTSRAELTDRFAADGR